jgi:hypothetical protein
VTVGFSALGDLRASIDEDTRGGFGDEIFVHHNSIATDTTLRSAATWEFNGTRDGGFFLSSTAMFKVVNANWEILQDYALGNCTYSPPPRAGSADAPAGDFSGAQLDPSGTGFWLAGERADRLPGREGLRPADMDPFERRSCQWGTRIAQVTP